MINAHTSFVILNAHYLEKGRAFTYTIVTLCFFYIIEQIKLVKFFIFDFLISNIFSYGLFISSYGRDKIPSCP